MRVGADCGESLTEPPPNNRLPSAALRRLRADLCPMELPMTTTYVGFWRAGSGAEEVGLASVRETGALPQAFVEKVNSFAKNLPSTCKLIGSWAISGEVSPGVMIVEAESYADLVHINQYYWGWIAFDWHPSNTVARNE